MWKFNPFTMKLDYYQGIETFDDRYVKKSGDTMTGELIINPATGVKSLTARKQICLKAGEKLIFDVE